MPVENLLLIGDLCPLGGLGPGGALGCARTERHDEANGDLAMENLVLIRDLHQPRVFGPSGAFDLAHPAPR